MAIKLGEMPVKKIMKREFPKLHPEDDIETALIKFIESGFQEIPVIRDGKFEGEITVRELLKLAIKPEDFVENVLLPEYGFDSSFFAKKVSEISKKHNIYVTPETEVWKAASLMVKENVSIIPVTDGEKLVGIVTAMDILRCISIEKAGGRK